MCERDRPVTCWLCHPPCNVETPFLDDRSLAHQDIPAHDKHVRELDQDDVVPDVAIEHVKLARHNKDMAAVEAEADAIEGVVDGPLHGLEAVGLCAQIDGHNELGPMYCIYTRIADT